ncbi:hypothetical protein AL755_13205 [Arthrobacter sp. ERGS1:01]|nr:hypothetical protein AL755_13205 [Arthrobacter sp. ERGS1:01]
MIVSIVRKHCLQADHTFLKLLRGYSARIESFVPGGKHHKPGIEKSIEQSSISPWLASRAWSEENDAAWFLRRLEDKHVQSIDVANVAWVCMTPE